MLLVSETARVAVVAGYFGNKRLDNRPRFSKAARVGDIAGVFGNCKPSKTARVSETARIRANAGCFGNWASFVAYAISKIASAGVSAGHFGKIPSETWSLFFQKRLRQKRSELEDFRVMGFLHADSFRTHAPR